MITQEKKTFINRLKKFCKERLNSFKVPVKIRIIENEMYSERFKKDRKVTN